MILSRARRLRTAGVLGLNGRNADYTTRFNPRHLHPLVDDKLQTKTLALDANLAVPRLYAVIEMEHQIRELNVLLNSYSDFVIKPAHGSSGDGVLVIKERTRQAYRLASGDVMDQGQLNHYVSNILGGLYSLGGHPDKAIIEYRVKSDDVFSAVSYAGVPDVRIIVFLGIPVMAMMRLPTRNSGGKANLHQGAVGAGIDMRSGQTLTAVVHNSIIKEHPDTGHSVAGLQIPHWETLLSIAARCHELTGLGYIGVDIVLDGELGPLVLEINARPGLNIQLANRAGLLPRLKLVEREAHCLQHLQQRVAFAREWLAHGSETRQDQ